MPIVSYEEFVSTKFDYLIVGGGTSGLAVAARLAENTAFTVGVIEAGEYHENDPEVTVPGMMAKAIHNPKFDWMFYTVPQDGVNGRKVLQSRGKGLGGSSLLNFLASVRPAKEELDAFATLGNEGWTWDSMLHYMKKSERLMPPPISGDQAKLNAVDPIPSIHGTSGPIAKSYPPHIPVVHVPLLDALDACEIPRNPDNNDGRPVGSVLFPTSVDSSTGTRSYSATGYYAPNATRPNLVVLLSTFVTKINFVKDDNGLQQATSIDIINGDLKATISAQREVILSAGSFQTPQLLELSGIGDKTILERFGIDTLVDLPGVGANLQDHALVPTIVEVDKQVESLEILHDPAQLQKQQELYKQAKGILAGIPSSCFAFIPGNKLVNDTDLAGWATNANFAASGQVFADTHPDVKRGIQKQYDILRTWVEDPVHPMSQLLNLNGHFPIPGLKPDPSKRYMTLLCAYCHPFHRGTVHINSTDPLSYPDINQNYLSNPTDLDVLVRTIQFVQRVYDAKPLERWVLGKVAPTPETTRDVEALREYIKDRLLTVHHPVGTASMLPREDGGVVDSQLRVYGTSHLRIVDCSIIPLQISANIQTLAYAIAEKAADMIMESSA
ncbi:hypothetical protein ONZ45_g5550 [Pleurotus djamor]|nr:hypothetical protein ONZ45_g5550 [Pleurotus djamor]